MTSFPDYPILCIDDDTNSKVFVFYDSKTGFYELRGKNHDTTPESFYYVPFAFQCHCFSGLWDFLNFHFDLPGHNVNVTLYNYNNLPELSSEIDFDFLESFENDSYAIFFYTDQLLSKKSFKRVVNILENIGNPY